MASAAEARLAGLVALVLLQLCLLAFLLHRQHSHGALAALTTPASSGHSGVALQPTLLSLQRSPARENRGWASPFHSSTLGRRVPRSALPNILLAIADDLPRTALGAYGSALGVTPALDALAASGRHLDEVHTPSPLCTPSRVALLTGHHASCAYYSRERRTVRQMRLDGTVGESVELDPLNFNLVLAPGLGGSERQHNNASQHTGSAATPGRALFPETPGVMQSGRWNNVDSLPAEVSASSPLPKRNILYKFGSSLRDDEAREMERAQQRHQAQTDRSVSAQVDRSHASRGSNIRKEDPTAGGQDSSAGAHRGGPSKPMREGKERPDGRPGKGSKTQTGASSHGANDRISRKEATGKDGRSKSDGRFSRKAKSSNSKGGGLGLGFEGQGDPQQIELPRSTLPAKTDKHIGKHDTGVLRSFSLRQEDVSAVMEESADLAGIALSTSGIGSTLNYAPTDGAWAGATTIGHVLRLRGYSSAFVGKWHMGHPRTNLSAADRRRVQRTPAAEWKSVRDVVLREYKRVQGMVREAGFDYAERIYVNNLYAEQHVLPAAMLLHNVEWIVEGATKFIAMPRRNPFFLVVAWTLPHNPDVELSISGDVRFTPGGLWNCNRTAVSAARESVRLRATRLAPSLLPRYGHKHYPLALAWMDSGMDSILGALRQASLEASTLVIFTADHHSYDKSHCYTYGSQVPLIIAWPGTIPPLASHTIDYLEPIGAASDGLGTSVSVASGTGRIIGGANIPPEPRYLLSHLDIAPTIYDAADVPPHRRFRWADSPRALGNVSIPTVPGESPTQPGSRTPPQLFGHSLAGLLLKPPLGQAAGAERRSEENGLGHDYLFCEVGMARSVFTKTHRLIWAPQIKPISKGGSTDTHYLYQVNKHHPAYWKPLQLYDLRSDPLEQINVIDDPTHATELKRLRELLDDHVNMRHTFCDDKALPGVTSGPSSKVASGP